MADGFLCTVVTPEAQVFDGKVAYASIPAWDGQVGLMHLRAPMLCKLGDGALRLDPLSGSPRWFFVAGGFAQMKDDRLTIVATQATPADQINSDEAKAAFKAAQSRVAVGDEAIAARATEQRQAAARLNVASRLK